MLSGRIDNEPMWLIGTGTWSALYVVAPKHSRNVVLTLPPANKTLVDRRVVHAAKADAALVGGLEHKNRTLLCAECRGLRPKGAAVFRGGEALQTLRAEANAKSQATMRRARLSGASASTRRLRGHSRGLLDGTQKPQTTLNPTLILAI